MLFGKQISSGAQLAFQLLGIRDERQKQAMMEKLYQSQMLSAESQRESAGQARRFQALQMGELEKGIQKKETFAKGITEALKIPPQPIDFPGMTYGMVYGPEEELGRITEEYKKVYPEEYYEMMAKSLMKGQEPYILGPEERRMIGGKEIARGIGKIEKPISMGNAAELAMNEKFGMNWQTNPSIAQQAHIWLGTGEGKEKIAEWTQRIVAPAITYLQTEKGFVPVTTRGPETGKVGAPTGLGKPLPSEMVIAEQQIGTLKEALGRVKKTYKSEYVGPIAGRFGKFKEKWIDIPIEQAKFYSDIAQLQNTLVYLYSGKQINENEFKRLMEQLPDESLPESTFKARMENFEGTIKSIIENRRRGMGGYGIPQTKIEPEEERKVIRRGIEQRTDKRVIEYSDGTIEYETEEPIKKEKFRILEVK